MTKKISDGVGKKIVEALKKQSEIEVNPMSEKENEEIFETLAEDLSDDLSETFGDDSQDEDLEEETLVDSQDEDYLDNLSNKSETFAYDQAPLNLNSPQPSQSFVNYNQPKQAVSDNFISELDSFEIPSNIAVLKKLISQLPSGVTRHTGAQIIKQTMEALGISMKSVLQEAQQVQESLNSSAKECHSTIKEYKKQIMVLEKQAQNHQRQYGALNELISLFIQTGV